MPIAGIIAVSLIGVSLGLIGGGGSILTVPALVYLFGLAPDESTFYSLFIVGVTSMVGAMGYYMKEICFQTSLFFGISSVTTVLLTRRFMLANLPDVFFDMGVVHITKSVAIMVLFALLMLVASYFMIRKEKHVMEKTATDHPKTIRLLSYGVGVGLVTGLLGAGGGFILIPAFVLVLKFNMRKAIGTSLMIIAVNSLVGFLGDVSAYAVDWKTLLSITALACFGIFIGSFFNKKIAGDQLKRTFGWFVLCIGVIVLVKEIYVL